MRVEAHPNPRKAAPDARPVTAIWAEMFVDLPYVALTEAVIERAKLALLDLVGVAVAGGDTRVGQSLTDYFGRMGGPPEADIVATGFRMPAMNAATVNGAHGHTLELDDGHRLAAGHPGTVVIPAALACATAHRRSGKDLLRAIVVGYEVFVRIAALINPMHLRRGFHTTATVGPFAAAAAAVVVSPGADAGRFVRALGLAGVQGAGLLEVLRDGAMAKPLQVGRASGAGVLAADLAVLGVEGPRRILEGPEGFIAAMAGDVDIAPLTERLCEDWAILGAYYKPYAACRHTHAAIEAMLRLRTEYGLRAEDVASLTVRTYPVAVEMCGSSVPPIGPAEAKFSIPFAVALALSRGHAGASGFNEDAVKDESLRAVARRVRVVADPAFAAAYPGRRSSAVDVQTTSGSTLTIEVPVARGEPEQPLSLADVSAKFRGNLGGQLRGLPSEIVQERILRIEELADVSALWNGERLGASQS